MSYSFTNIQFHAITVITFILCLPYYQCYHLKFIKENHFPLSVLFNDDRTKSILSSQVNSRNSIPSNQKAVNKSSSSFPSSSYTSERQSTSSDNSNSIGNDNNDMSSKSSYSMYYYSTFSNSVYSQSDILNNFINYSEFDEYDIQPSYFEPKGPWSGIKNDLSRRSKVYRSDWTDGLQRKSISASIFLYFACLAPTIAFGGIANSITNGQMGVIHFMLSTGLSGMLYAMFSGQPMTFLGPTGLTLAFITALYRYTESHSLPFLALYSWTGLWTSLFLALSSIYNLAKYIRSCTRFTDDCFNAVLAMNFLYEAFQSIANKFVYQINGVLSKEATLISGFASLNIAIATWISTKTLSKMRSTHLFNKSIRKFLSDFGATISILCMSIIASHPSIKSLGIEFLKFPSMSFSIKSYISNSIPKLFTLQWKLRLLAIIPAILLTMLFYLDHNISIRAVNSFDLKKGEAYHWDLMVLAGIVGLQSIIGLPWTCAATVQSLNHVRAMSSPVGPSSSNVASNVASALTATTTKTKTAAATTVVVAAPVPSSSIPSSSQMNANTNLIMPGSLGISSSKLSDTTSSASTPTVTSIGLQSSKSSQSVVLPSYSSSIPFSSSGVVGYPAANQSMKVLETRITGFTIHAMILLSVGLLPLISKVPLPVISGIFLFLGERMTQSNLFLERLCQLFVEKQYLPNQSSFKKLSKSVIAKYVMIQSIALVSIWFLKQSKQLSLLFPSCIGGLILLRWKVLPWWFNDKELKELDPAI